MFPGATFFWSTQTHIHKILAFALCCTHRGLWGESEKRLSVRAVTLVGHSSVTCWGMELWVDAGCGGLGLVFDTQESGPGACGTAPG